jgi:hypothetical protein
VQFVEALCHQTRGFGSDFRYGPWNFQVAYSVFPHSVALGLTQPLTQLLLTWGPRTPWGSVNLDEGKKITTLFSLTSDRNAAFHSIMNVGNKVIYGLWTPKFCVNFNRSHYLYFRRLNEFYSEQVSVSFTRLKGGRGTKKKIKNPCSNRNYYQGISLGVNCGRRLELTTLPSQLCRRMGMSTFG